MGLFMCDCFSPRESGNGERKALNTRLLPTHQYWQQLVSVKIMKSELGFQHLWTRSPLELAWELETGRQRLVSSRRWGKKASWASVSLHAFSSGNNAQKTLMKMSEYTAILEPFGNFFCSHPKRSLGLPTANVARQLVCRRTQLSHTKALWSQISLLACQLSETAVPYALTSVGLTPTPPAAETWSQPNGCLWPKCGLPSDIWPPCPIAPRAVPSLLGPVSA